MPRAGEPDGASREAMRVALLRVCDVSCFVVLGYLVASRIFYAEFGVGLIFGADRLILLGTAIGLTLVRACAGWIGTRWTLAASTALIAVALPLMVLPLAGINLETPVRATLRPLKARFFPVLFGTTPPRGLYQLDDRYGFVHVPGAHAAEQGRGYSATYAIDADGNRVMPAPAAPRSSVVFLGDSFTFGAGVSDHQTFSYVLATEHWTDVKVINSGVGGWGLTQLHLRLSDVLAQPQLPVAVFAAIIPDDLRRSHLRPPIVPGLTTRLEWIDGEWVSRPQVYGRALVEETPALLEQEARLATASFSAMSAMARARRVAFGVILLDDDGAYPPEMVYALAENAIPVLDLSRLGHTWLPYDAHPDPAGHRAIANAIAASPLTGIVYGRTHAE